MPYTEFFQEIKIFSTIVHVISVVLGMGSALVSDLLFSFFSKDKKLNSTEIKTLSFLSRVVLLGLIVISISGIFIFLSDSGKYMASDKFLAKMSILLVLLLNGLFLNKIIWPHLMEKNFFQSVKNKIRTYAFACGAISVTSWLAVCTLGVLEKIKFSYIETMVVYLGVLAFAILIALIIEKLEFRS